MNIRHIKILIIFLILATMAPSAAFAQDATSSEFMNFNFPFAGGSPVIMQNNNGRFVPANLDAPALEPRKSKKDKSDADVKPEGNVEIISDHLEYFREEDKIVATGNAVATSADKKNKLKADKLTFYRDTNELVAEGNVRAMKEGSIVYGSFMRMDMNKNTGFMTNPKTGNSLIKIVAREGYVYGKDIELFNGKAKMAQGMGRVVGSKPIGVGFEQLDNQRMLDLAQDPEYLKENKKVYRIKAKEIVIDAGSGRNDIVMKAAKIYRDDKKIGTMSKLVLAGDANMGEMETSLPEIGYLRQMGLYAGPSFLLDGPGSSSLKLSPNLIYGGGERDTGQKGNGGVGIGGIARFHSETNQTLLAYGSSHQTTILRGTQELFDDDRIKFNYSYNAYMDDWFMGGKLPYKFAEIAFRDQKNLDDLGLVYRYKYSGALASDYATGDSADWRMNSTEAQRRLPHHDQGWGTAKLKAQGEFMRQKPVWEIKDKITLNVLGQYDINQYGTGDTYSIVRIGPTFLYTPTDKFRIRSSYFMSGIQGRTPFAWDQYYMGKQSETVSWEYQLTKKLAIGTVETLNLLRDNYDARFIAENRFFFKYGPDDFKVCFSYDTLWRRTAMSLNMLVGSDKSNIDFDKLKVKNFKNLQKQQEDQKLKDEQKIKKEEEV